MCCHSHSHKSCRAPSPSTQPPSDSNCSVALVDFKFIFDVPPKLTNPQSLRTVLLSEKSYPLEERLELPKKLTASILFVPQCNSFTRIFDQKQSIFSETNILKLKHRFFPGLSNSVSRTELPFFQGMIFGTTICVAYSIVPKGSQLIALPLDRHPSRQDTQPEIDCRMQHDIYTLGVVLLEIGLWTSLAVEDSECDSNLPTPSNILDSVKLGLFISTISCSRGKTEARISRCPRIASPLG